MSICKELIIIVFIMYSCNPFHIGNGYGNLPTFISCRFSDDCHFSFEECFFVTTCFVVSVAGSLHYVANIKQKLANIFAWKFICFFSSENCTVDSVFDNGGCYSTEMCRSGICVCKMYYVLDLSSKQCVYSESNTAIPFYCKLNSIEYGC